MLLSVSLERALYAIKNMVLNSQEFRKYEALTVRPGDSFSTVQGGSQIYLKSYCALNQFISIFQLLL